MDLRYMCACVPIYQRKYPVCMSREGIWRGQNVLKLQSFLAKCSVSPQAWLADRLIHALLYGSDGGLSCQIWDGDFDHSLELQKTGFHSQAFMFIKFESGNARQQQQQQQKKKLT